MWILLNGLRNKLMSDDFDDLSNEEIEDAVKAALGEILNIATIAGDMQRTDEAADDIYALCDLVAEYYQIERAQVLVEEHEDGSYTTRFEPLDSDLKIDVTKTPIPGHIRTKGRPKLRLVDSSTPVQDQDEPTSD
jgi:hypothetical protein